MAQGKKPRKPSKKPVPDESVLKTFEELYRDSKWDEIVSKSNTYPKSMDDHGLVQEFKIMALTNLDREDEALELATQYWEFFGYFNRPESSRFSEIHIMLGDLYRTEPGWLVPAVKCYCRALDDFQLDKKTGETLFESIETLVDECKVNGSLFEMEMLLEVLLHYKSHTKDWLMKVIKEAVVLKKYPRAKWQLEATVIECCDGLLDAFQYCTKKLRDEEPTDEKEDPFTWMMANIMGAGYFELGEFFNACTWYSKAKSLLEVLQPEEKGMINYFQWQYEHAYELFIEQDAYLLEGPKETQKSKTEGKKKSRSKNPQVHSTSEDSQTLDDHNPEDQAYVVDKDQFSPFQVQGEVSLTVANRISVTHYNGYIETKTSPEVYQEFTKSFIVAHSDQLLNSKEMITQSCRNEGVLRVEFLKYCDKIKSTVLVCEQVLPLKEFFQKDLEVFKQSPGSGRDKWWKLIAVKFRQIFGDVLRTMRLLLRKDDRSCGKRLSSIYVTEEGRGKIMVSFDPQVRPSDDIIGLKLAMLSIIDLPFPADGRSFTERNGKTLPVDLIAFFKVFHTDNLAYVPLEWLLDSPFFRDADGRIAYLCMVFELMKQDLIDCDGLNLALGKRQKYGIADTGSWMKLVEDGHGTFTILLQKGLTDKVAEYLKPVDIIRYCIVAYHYFNEYAAAPDSSGRMDLAKVEQELSLLFPELHSEIIYSLILHAKWKCHLKEEIEATYLRLTRESETRK